MLLLFFYGQQPKALYLLACQRWLGIACSNDLVGHMAKGELIDSFVDKPVLKS